MWMDLCLVVVVFMALAAIGSFLVVIQLLRDMDEEERRWIEDD